MQLNVVASHAYHSWEQTSSKKQVNNQISSEQASKQASKQTSRTEK